MALLASLAVAVIVTPALCVTFLPHAASIERGHDGWLTRRLKAWFARVLPPALDHPRLVIAVSVVLLGAAVAALTQAGTAFLPEFHEGSLTVQANTLPGTSLAKSNEIGRRVEEILLSQPEVVATARRTGRAEYDEHVQGVEAAEIDVGLRPAARPREVLLAELRRQFATLPGTNVTIGQPISHRIDHMLSGTRANIAVKVFGDDLGTLRRLGERVRSAVGTVPGVVDLSLEQQMDVPFVRFVLNRSMIARYGLRPEDVAEAVETSLAGATVGRIFDRGTAFDLTVKFDAAAGADFERIADLPVDTPGGAIVPVRSLADVRREQGPNMVLRENVQRRIVISANVAGRDLGGVVADIRRAVSQSVQLPAGYRVEYGGQFESEQSASQRLRALGVLALGGRLHAARAGVRARARRPDRHGEPAAGAHRRCGRRVPLRRRAQRGDHDRLHHAVRDRHAQRHHARDAHPSPDERRTRARLPGGCRTGRGRAACADHHDGGRGGPRARAAGDSRRPDRTAKFRRRWPSSSCAG